MKSQFGFKRKRKTTQAIVRNTKRKRKTTQAIVWNTKITITVLFVLE
jgi:hypothetical protein